MKPTERKWLRFRGRLPGLPLWIKSFGLFLAASTLPLLCAGVFVLRVRMSEAETQAFQMLLMRLRMVEQELMIKLAEKGMERDALCGDKAPALARKKEGGTDHFVLFRGSCKTVDLGTTDEFVRMFKVLEAEDTLILFDHENQPLVSNVIEAEYSVPDAMLAAVKPRGEFFNSLYAVEISGIRYVALHLPVHTLGVHAVALRPHDVVMAGVRHATWVQIWILGGAGFVSLIAGILAVNWHMKPLRQIEQFVAAVARGDFSVIPRAEGRDERRAIFRRLNSLRMRLRRDRAFVMETTLEENRTATEGLARRQKELVAHLSHEIRTPLAMITGLAETLADRITNEEDKVLLQRAREAGSGALELLNSLLESARMESTGGSRPPRPFRMTDILHHLESLFRDAALRKGLSLEIDPGWEIPAVLLGDRHHLRQILTNLLGNAVKYTVRGSIILRVRVLEKTADKIRLRFDVMDTGPGFDAAAKEKLFDRFATTEDRADSTGLGLAITRELVEHLGGEIQLTSVPGQGSVFSVDLPFDAATDVPSSMETGRPAAPIKVLVVEDIDVLRTVYRTYLRGDGAVVDYAADGAEALTLYARGRYDIIMLDMQLPDMDGTEIARRMRRQEVSDGRAPSVIIACTARTLGEDVQEIKDAGCDGALGKPFSREELLGVVFGSQGRFASKHS